MATTGATLGGDQGFTLGGDTGATAGSPPEDRAIIGQFHEQIELTGTFLTHD